MDPLQAGLEIAVLIIKILGPVVVSFLTGEPDKDAIELLDNERIADILPMESRVEIAQHAARLRAVEKSGAFINATGRQRAVLEAAMSLMAVVEPAGSSR